MDRQTQQSLFNEIKGYIASGSTKLADSEMPHPAAVYYDPEHLAREKRMLARYPLVVGHSDQLKNAGDYIAHDLTGMPIVVARQKDGSLKAFVNVCSHRGARVCDQPHGNASQFTCPYHAWSFRTDGTLKGVPRSAFPGLDKEKASLTPLAVEERLGLIWVQTDAADGFDISQHLGTLESEIDGLDIDDCVLHRAEVFEADINWKCVLDGFLEIYHFSALHGGSIGPYFYGTHSPFDSFGENGRLLGVRKSFDTIADKPFDDVEFLPNVAVNYLLFPNTVLVWQGDHFECWTSFPGKEPGKCRVLVQMIIPKAIYGEETMSRWRRNWQIMIDTVIDEDWAISQDVQSALPHIAHNQITFGANEPGLQHFHGKLDQVLRGLN